MFLRSAFYDTKSQIVYEGATISVFGKLKYDISKDTFEFDQPQAILEGTKEDLLDHINFELMTEAALTSIKIVGAFYAIKFGLSFMKKACQ